MHGTAIWYVQPVPGTAGRWSALTAPDVIRLKTNSGSLYLRATQSFCYGVHPQFEGERKVLTEDYVYTLSADEALQQELYSWQWHPGAWPEPHVHVGRRNPSLGDLGKLHIPTGRVAFEQVLKFAIGDHGVLPARGDDAIDILDESLRRFQLYRSWS